MATFHHPLLLDKEMITPETKIPWALFNKVCFYRDFQNLPPDFHDGKLGEPDQKITYQIIYVRDVIPMHRSCFLTILNVSNVSLQFTVLCFRSHWKDVVSHFGNGFMVQSKLFVKISKNTGKIRKSSLHHLDCFASID